MPLFSRVTFLLLLLAAFESVSARGIVVRFLPNLPEDSITRYLVYRSTESGRIGTAIGEVLPLKGVDTLRFPDLSAAKGIPYFYSVVGVDAAGRETEASVQTLIALPKLALPDSASLVRTASGTQAALPLNPEARPLGSSVPLKVSVSDTSRVTVSFDSASGKIVLRAKTGWTGLQKVVVTASYYGKFEDRDSLVLRGQGVTSIDRSSLASASAAESPALRVFQALEKQLTGKVSTRILSSAANSGASHLAAAHPAAETFRAELVSLQGRKLWGADLRASEAVQPVAAPSTASSLGQARAVLRLLDGRGRLLHSASLVLAPAAR